MRVFTVIHRFNSVLVCVVIHRFNSVSVCTVIHRFNSVCVCIVIHSFNSVRVCRRLIQLSACIKVFTFMVMARNSKFVKVEDDQKDTNKLSGECALENNESKE